MRDKSGAKGLLRRLLWVVCATAVSTLVIQHHLNFPVIVGVIVAVVLIWLLDSGSGPPNRRDRDQ